MSRRSQGSRTAAGEDGFTLIELLVSIALLSVVISVFLGATNAMFTTLRKQQGLADAADSNRRAFLLLDRQVRYASGINLPGLGADGNYYVDFQGLNTSSSPTCYQWRLAPATDLLQWRSWSATAATVAPPPWLTVATGEVNSVSSTPGVPNPFTLTTTAPDGTTPNVVLAHQELLVHLEAARNQPAGKATTNTSFTAQNTAGSAVPSPPICQQVGRS